MQGGDSGKGKGSDIEIGSGSDIESVGVAAAAVVAALVLVAAAASPTQPMCAAVGCGKPAISRCSRCLGAFYCGRECQLVAWPDHKGQCKEVVETRASMKVDSIEGVNKDDH